MSKTDTSRHPYRGPPGCNHGVAFDPPAQPENQLLQKSMDSSYVRNRWPRLQGLCPLGCGYKGVAYASMKHYVMGDW